MTNFELAIKSVAISLRVSYLVKQSNLNEKTNCAGPLLAENYIHFHALGVTAHLGL